MMTRGFAFNCMLRTFLKPRFHDRSNALSQMGIAERTIFEGSSSLVESPLMWGVLVDMKNEEHLEYNLNEKVQRNYEKYKKITRM